ncbi:MAG: response regulator [Treponema sp.]|nr:response regulator [Treponema sp.]
MSETLKPDFAIIDHNLHGEVNAFALIEAIRAAPDFRALPIAAMLPITENDSWQALQSKGANVYIGLPLRLEAAMSTLSRLVFSESAAESFPAFGDSDKADESIPEAPVETAPPLRVLLAEDNVVNRLVASRMLIHLGCEVEVAVNGREAVDKSAARDYAVIFMDCHMPEMDGYEATLAIRKRELEDKSGGWPRRQFIVALTANAIQGDRDRCLAVGMDDYVSKPLSIDDLQAVFIRHAAKFSPEN